MLIATLLLSLAFSFSNRASEPTRAPDSPFDQYGAIGWEDEKARLDNFAVQLQNWSDGVGFILVVDSPGLCPGEAVARAIRAKRYVVEFRGIPANRVGWRRDGADADFRTTLLMVPRDASLPFPFYGTWAYQVDRPVPRDCKARLRKISRSKLRV